MKVLLLMQYMSYLEQALMRYFPKVQVPYSGLERTIQYLVFCTQELHLTLILTVVQKWLRLRQIWKWRISFNG